MEFYVGMIWMWPINFVPKDFVPCDGRLLPVSEYTLLYALIGPNFGGDGVRNFAVPDLRGRVPVGIGSTLGGSYYRLGWRGGAETIAVQPTSAYMPAHTHTLTNTSGTTSSTNVDVKIQVSTDVGERDTAQENDYIGQTSQVMGKDVDLFRSDDTSHVNVLGGKAEISGKVVPVDGHMGISGKGKEIELSLQQPYLGMAYYICTDGLFPSRN